ncbi:hypothetical protein [Methylomicrobium sp. Wu6]|uniref:hypothetical protein n=1 Tax=Methylomicrobium sp. Wu6 TaxID=3107928 RepID=UPI002DD69DA8|nr:hypothetical protein [Methylomicrobium sp. Wu6]MEC4750169.1 hypothetical protein [Methylomicrobium sp. Wu6]
MNIINLRKHVRRSSDTCLNADRRGSPNQNSAAELQEKMQGRESAFSKLNRRKAERRQEDRRRPVSDTQQGDQILPPGTRYARFKLTRGERNLIQDMFLSDLENE